MDERDMDPAADGPGRPVQVARRPSERRHRRIIETQEALHRHVVADPVVAAAALRDRAETLRQVLVETSVEAAALAWERSQQPSHHREFARITSRRVTALVQVARVAIALHQLAPEEPAPATIERVLRSLLDAAVNAARDVLPASDLERFTDALNRRDPIAAAQREADRRRAPSGGVVSQK